MNGWIKSIRFTISLDEPIVAGLVVLAKQQYRDPRVQAAVIIREELQRRGLLQSEAPTTQAHEGDQPEDQTLDGK